MKEIRTLIGSSKYKKQFEEASAILEMKGIPVLRPNIYEKCENISVDTGTKDVLLYNSYKKILLADSVGVVEGEKYIGEATEKEIIFSLLCNKKVYLNPIAPYECPEQSNMLHIRCYQVKHHITLAKLAELTEYIRNTLKENFTLEVNIIGADTYSVNYDCLRIFPFPGTEEEFTNAVCIDKKETVSVKPIKFEQIPEILVRSIICISGKSNTFCRVITDPVITGLMDDTISDPAELNQYVQHRLFSEKAHAALKWR